MELRKFGRQISVSQDVCPSVNFTSCPSDRTLNQLVKVFLFENAWCYLAPQRNQGITCRQREHYQRAGYTKIRAIGERHVWIDDDYFID